MHFKELKILNKEIYYKQIKSHRARRTTSYPMKKLKKPFDNILELLDYLSGKFYDIEYFKLELETNLKIKTHSNAAILFYTDSIIERNLLISKFVKIVGYNPLQIEDLKNNIPYFWGKDYILSDYGFGPSPDEFWREEEKEKWIIEEKIRKNW